MDKKSLAYILYFNYGPDLLGVIIGLKPAARCIIREREVNLFIDFCHKYDLKYVFSDYRYNMLRNEVIVKDMSSNILKMYVSKSTKICEKLRYYDEKDDKITGRLLGYPDCCINFYLDLVKNKNHQEVDFVQESLSNTSQKIDFKINNVREWCGKLQIDYSLIDYFPCSYNCRNAIKYAGKLFRYIEKIDKNQSDHIKKQLLKPILYYGNRTAKQISKPLKRGKSGKSILVFE